jgi:hypothetical protein
LVRPSITALYMLIIVGINKLCLGKELPAAPLFGLRI